MVMPLCGTFAYSTTVPVDGQNTFPWEMKSLESFMRSGNPLVDKRLVGWSPLLYIREAGLPPNPSSSVPSVGRSEIRLVATDKKCADLLRWSWSFGNSGAKLVFAVGVVGAVPLGSEISVKIPYELLTKAEAILRQRDPEFELPHHPIEICIGNRPKILYRGHLQMGGYHVWVEHVFLPGMPGTEESVSITLDEACDWVAGSASAHLLSLP
jgi:hypothetical protein